MFQRKNVKTSNQKSKSNFFRSNNKCGKKCLWSLQSPFSKTKTKATFHTIKKKNYGTSLMISGVKKC